MLLEEFLGEDYSATACLFFCSFGRVHQHVLNTLTDVS